jgi:hypothetical protein
MGSGDNYWVLGLRPKTAFFIIIIKEKGVTAECRNSLMLLVGMTRFELAGPRPPGVYSLVFNL